MLIFKKVSSLQKWLSKQRKASKTIGFTPTMGALHEGHLQLIDLANKQCDVSVSSIFVNPTQFNDPKDLDKYPRTPGKDIALLEGAGCSAVFMPSVEEVYPKALNVALNLDFGALAEVMEGKFRPGHFAGMATVVNRLLNIVQPDQLIMGQKDFQQLTIVRDMLRQLKSKTELVMCPTMREADGLAMSSRNTRLTPEMRQVAPVIFQTLNEVKKRFQNLPAHTVCAWAMDNLTAAGLRPEYVEIVDAITLQPIENYENSPFSVCCIAAFAGEIRLIDNLVLKQN